MPYAVALVMGKNIINEFNKITRWPKKPLEKATVIKFLATRFSADKKYSEKEVNQIINTSHYLITFVRYENILPSIMASKSYDSDTKELLFDQKIYDSETKVWKRKSKKNYQAGNKNKSYGN